MSHQIERPHNNLDLHCKSITVGGNKIEGLHLGRLLGPTGPKGSTGEIGPVGWTGPKGADGKDVTGPTGPTSSVSSNQQDLKLRTQGGYICDLSCHLMQSGKCVFMYLDRIEFTADKSDIISTVSPIPVQFRPSVGVKQLCYFSNCQIDGVKPFIGVVHVETSGVIKIYQKAEQPYSFQEGEYYLLEPMSMAWLQ